ncbi:hypothetical protein CITRIK5_70807 [Citricoccus sp. K5]|nr:hypothetical protein CITRIK5_70807 [Citricoccus sp. K5]
MSDACCSAAETTGGASEEAEAHRPWWRDAAILLPVLSGVAFLTGLVLEWSGAGVAATVVFWVGHLGPALPGRGGVGLGRGGVGGSHGRSNPWGRESGAGV